MSIPTVGDPLTEAELTDLEGNNCKLSDFNDKYLLLSFWSMTCMTCMKSARHLKKFIHDHSAKVNVVSVNMDTDRVKWEMGTSRDKIDWTNLSDGKGSMDGVGKAYGIFGYPAYVLINPEGQIIDRWMGYKPGRFDEKAEEHIK